jgi:hypothetical protein
VELAEVQCDNVVPLTETPTLTYDKKDVRKSLASQYIGGLEDEEFSGEEGKGVHSDGKHTVIYCALILVLLRFQMGWFACWGW